MKFKLKCAKPIIYGGLAFFISGCATMQDLGSNYGQELGCLTGMVAGAIIGNQVGSDSTGAMIGAGIGTAIGCYAGSVWQSRMQALKAVAQEENLTMTVEPLQTATSSRQPKEVGLVAQVEDTSMFAIGSSELTTDGRRKVQKIAAVFAQELSSDDDTSSQRLLVVGHTDATGSAELNKRLSEQRARNVSHILQQAGIAANRIYYQGAGSSRPIADNRTIQGRNQNRRVEINAIASEELLAQRVEAESANAKYLAFGTSTKPAPSSNLQQQNQANTLARYRPPRMVAPAIGPAPKVDFGGMPRQADARNIVSTIKPKSGGFSFISSAHASDIPIQNCSYDEPRASGEVLSLESGKPLVAHNTRDYLPGYNNRVWANTVNGHLVTISPVSILRDNAAVSRQPFLEIVEGYKSGNRKSGYKLNAVASTFEGEDEVLYRIHIVDKNSPIRCADIVFDKRDAKASAGQLFYPVGSKEYIAKFIPIRTR